MSDRSKQKIFILSPNPDHQNSGPGTRRPGAPAEEGMRPVALLRSWNGDTVSLDLAWTPAWTPAWTVVGQIVKIANKLVGM